MRRTSVHARVCVCVCVCVWLQPCIRASRAYVEEPCQRFLRCSAAFWDFLRTWGVVCRACWAALRCGLLSVLCHVDLYRPPGTCTVMRYSTEVCLCTVLPNSASMCIVHRFTSTHSQRRTSKLPAQSQASRTRPAHHTNGRASDNNVALMSLKQSAWERAKKRWARKRT